jgi:hypothetical protein
MPDNPEDLVPADTPWDVSVVTGEPERLYHARFTRGAELDRLAPERSSAWRALDLAYVHRFLLDECVTTRLLAGTPPQTHYVKSARQAILLAREAKGVALLCRACTMAELRAVSEAGDLMPQKSTYFYPKLATGLLINPLE